MVREFTLRHSCSHGSLARYQRKLVATCVRSLFCFRAFGSSYQLQFIHICRLFNFPNDFYSVITRLLLSLEYWNAHSCVLELRQDIFCTMDSLMHIKTKACFGKQCVWSTPRPVVSWLILLEAILSNNSYLRGMVSSFELRPLNLKRWTRVFNVTGWKEKRKQQITHLHTYVALYTGRSVLYVSRYFRILLMRSLPVRNIIPTCLILNDFEATDIWNSSWYELHVQYHDHSWVLNDTNTITNVPPARRGSQDFIPHATDCLNKQFQTDGLVVVLRRICHCVHRTSLP
jgi:hypothetical protein